MERTLQQAKDALYSSNAHNFEKNLDNFVKVKHANLKAKQTSQNSSQKPQM